MSLVRGLCTNLLKQTIKVNVNYITCVGIKKDVFAVTISEAVAGSEDERTPNKFKESIPKNKSNHGHNSECSTIAHPARQPRRGLRECFNEPVMKDWFVSMTRLENWQSNETNKGTQIISSSENAQRHFLVSWASIQQKLALFLWSRKRKVRLLFCAASVRYKTFPSLHPSSGVQFQKDRTNWNGVGNPLDESTFFVEGDNTICSDVWKTDKPSIKKVLDFSSLRSCLLLDSEFPLRSLLMMAYRSIKRASFLKSSFGFPRNMYTWPLLPLIVIFLGFASDFMISTSSENSKRETEISNEEPEKNWIMYLWMSVYWVGMVGKWTLQQIWVEGSQSTILEEEWSYSNCPFALILENPCSCSS